MRKTASLVLALLLLSSPAGNAQVPPSPRERASYSGIFAGAARGEAAKLRELVSQNAKVDPRDGRGRTPLHANDLATLRVALGLGASARNVTSRYDGTALIAAAHLGHAEVVRTLIRAGAPLDHVNNLGWTALIEAIVLGDGGARHADTLKALVEAGADVNLSDRSGSTPLALARQRGYSAMVRMLEPAGAR